MCLRYAGAVLLGCRMVSEAHDGGGSPGPLQMGSAAGWACRAVPLPGGCPGPWAQAARGDNILAPGDAGAIMDGGTQHTAEPLAEAGTVCHRGRGGGMAPGGVADGKCDVAQPRVVGGDERQSTCKTLVDGGSGTVLGHPPRGARCRRSYCPGPAGSPGCGDAAHARGVRPVGAPEACGA